MPDTPPPNNVAERPGRRDASDDWRELVRAMMLAGAIYPFVVVCGWGIVMAVVMLAVEPSYLPSALASSLPLICAVPIAMAIALLYTGIVAALVVAVVAMFLRSMQWFPRWDRRGAFCGGLVGMLATGLPFLMGFSRDPVLVAFVFAVGPGLATLMGQYAGALAGINNLDYDRISSSPFDVTPRTEPERFRVSTWQLLWIMTWLSIGLALLRAANMLIVATLALLIIWTPFQWVTGKLMVVLAWHNLERARRRRTARMAAPRST